MYIARRSDHIEEDLERGWSSWSFGDEGFSGTEEELKEEMDRAYEEGEPFYISGFDLWEEDIRNADIRELYEGYWVLVDNVNAKGGLSFIELDSEDEEGAIQEALSRRDYNGDGVPYSPDEIEMVFSDTETHVFRVK